MRPKVEDFVTQQSLEIGTKNWKKSYAKKIPEFTQHVLDYYAAWQNGDLDMDKLKEDLWEYGGIRLEVSE